MTSKIILYCPLQNPELLPAFVESCVREKVELIAVIGAGSEKIHDLIDDILIADGSSETRFITTTWHAGETPDDVIDFAAAFGNQTATIRQVRL